MVRHNLKFWKRFYKIRYTSSINEWRTIEEARFLRKFLPIRRYKKVLDFICGVGRHSIKLARAGYNVEGFDINEDSIGQARKIIKDRGLKNIKLYTKDALKFQKKEIFDAAICIYSSIGFLDENSNDKIFNVLCQSVRKDGRIILDVMNPNWAIKYLIPYQEKEIVYNGQKYLVRHHRKILYNPLREKNIIEFFNTRNRKQYKAAYILRLYFLKKLKEKFYKNNFRIYKIFGSFRKEKISNNQQRIIIIADRIK